MGKLKGARERYPVGDFVYARITEADRAAFLRFMRDADGHDYDDEGYCALGNAGVGVPVEEGAPIEEGDVCLLLETLSVARLLSASTEEADWLHILRIALRDDEDAVARVARLFAVASGIADSEAFDEDERWARVEEWERQRDRLDVLRIHDRYRFLPGPARPALVRWAREGGPIPAVDDEDAQLDLDVAAR